MEDLKIVGWVSFDSPYPSITENGPKLGEYISLINLEIVKNNYKFSGEEHQYSNSGCPLFSDGTCFRASMRCFGGIMSRIYSDIDGIEYSYMDFYMSLDDSNLPEEYETSGMIDDELKFGFITEQDMQIVNESISFGMEFMTTYKVLKLLYLMMQEENK